MTSNTGSQIILERGTADWAEVETAVLGALRHDFRPEFLNRVDDIIVFRPLSKAQLEEIVGTAGNRARCSGQNHWATPKPACSVGGYDPRRGRDHQRVSSGFRIAVASIRRSFHEGDHIVATEGPDGEIVFQKSEASQEEPAVAAR
jgi:ATP-dependent Clp protease ATP-binding subunit ClpB